MQKIFEWLREKPLKRELTLIVLPGTGTFKARLTESMIDPKQGLCVLEHYRGVGASGDGAMLSLLRNFENSLAKPAQSATLI